MFQKEEPKLNKKIDIRGFWRRLWTLLKIFQGQIKFLVGVIVVFEIAKLANPYILKVIIDLITNFKSQDILTIVVLILLMFAANQLVSIIDYFIDKKIIKIMADAEARLSIDAQNKMLFLPLGYHEKENTGNKISKIQRGVDKVNDLIGNFFWEVGPTVVQIIVTAIALFIFDWRFGFLFLICVPVFVKLTMNCNTQVYPYRVKRHDDNEESYGRMVQSIININTVKSFVQEKRENAFFSDYREKIRKNVIKEYFIIFKYNLGRNLVIDFGRVAVLFFGIFLVWKGNLSIGSLVFVITISEKALISLFRISRLYDRIMDSSEAIERLYQLGHEKSDIVNPVNGIKPKEIIGQIDFKNVSFTYKHSKYKALDNINLRINSGCVTALVGPSGGGKTTLARMIYRHYDPTEGEVLLDGKNLIDYDLYKFRKFIAIVPQEVELFNMSIMDNIAYANSKATKKEIEAAAKIANAHEFIVKIPGDYDAMVGERGIKLSGGQRQRVGIARAVLANPKILIFDEATSNLDSYSEKLIQQALANIGRGRTVIIIAHRLSTIRQADKIIVLEEGKVMETGSHFELSKADGGLYAKLLRLQEIGDVE